MKREEEKEERGDEGKGGEVGEEKVWSEGEEGGDVKGMEEAKERIVRDAADVINEDRFNESLKTSRIKESARKVDSHSTRRKR